MNKEYWRQRWVWLGRPKSSYQCSPAGASSTRPARVFAPSWNRRYDGPTKLAFGALPGRPRKVVLGRWVRRVGIGLAFCALAIGCGLDGNEIEVSDGVADGSVDAPAPAGETVTVMHWRGYAYSLAVAPMQSAQEAMVERADECLIFCPEIESGRRWLFVELTVRNSGEHTLDLGRLEVDLFGAAGVRRPGEENCGALGEVRRAEVLPGTEIQYVRCFDVPDSDLTEDAVLIRASLRIEGIEDPIWLISDATRVN